MRQVSISTVTVPATATAPASPWDLTTLADVKAELNIPDADTTNDVWLQRAITRGSRAIAHYCNRFFGVQSYQDLIYLQMDNYPDQVPGQNAPLELAARPLISITSVSVDNGFNMTETLSQGTDFMVDAEKGQLIRLNIYTTFPRPWDAIPTTVNYQAGYATIPDDLEQACLMWVSGRFQNRSRDPNLKSWTQNGMGTKEYWVPNNPAQNHFPPEIEDLLELYRDPVVQ